MWYQWAEGEYFGVRGARGRMELVGMRLLILIMGLIWVEVLILARKATIQERRFLLFLLPHLC